MKVSRLPPGAAPGSHAAARTKSASLPVSGAVPLTDSRSQLGFLFWSEDAAHFNSILGRFLLELFAQGIHFHLLFPDLPQIRLGLSPERLDLGSLAVHFFP